MIRIIRHKGLRALHEKGDTSGINPRWLKRLRVLLARLDASKTPADMDLPGARFHPLQGNLKGFFAVDVSVNWRMIFRFEEQDATDVDLTDYH